MRAIRRQKPHQQSRGTVASIIISFSFGILNFLVDKYGAIVQQQARISRIFGGTLGF